MKQDLYFSMNRVGVNVDWIKVYKIESKNGIMMKNVWV